MTFAPGQQVWHWNRGSGTFHCYDDVHTDQDGEGWVSFGSEDPDDAVRVPLSSLADRPPSQTKR